MKIDSLATFLNNFLLVTKDRNVKMENFLKNYINKHYNDFKHILDSNYLEQIDKNSNRIFSSFWEMHFCNVLKKSNPKVEINRFSTGKSNHGPDFKIKIQNTIFLTECVCPQNSDNPLNAVPDKHVEFNKDGSLKPHIEPFDPNNIYLRIRNSISEKNIQYKKWKERNIFPSNEIIVLAISLISLPSDPIFYFFNSPSFFLESNILGGLFPTGKPIVRYKSHGKNISVETKIAKMEKLGKPLLENPNNKVNIPDLLFNTYDWVSAVIISYEKGDLESDIASDFFLVHNPKAKNKLPEKLLNVREEYSSSRITNILTHTVDFYQ